MEMNMNTDVNTTPISTFSSVRYGGFWIRFVALVIDSVIMLIPSLLIHLIIPVVGSIILGFLYKPFFESSVLQATPGKALLGLRVTTLSGGRLTFKQAFIRTLATWLSAILLMVGYIMAAFTEKNQALHDMIADTVVVFQPPPLVNYLNAWMDEVQRVFGFAAPMTAGEVVSKENGNIAAKLEELHDLFNKGILTEEEYKTKKEELLKRM